jgi:hypothetical protein
MSNDKCTNHEIKLLGWVQPFLSGSSMVARDIPERSDWSRRFRYYAAQQNYRVTFPSHIPFAIVRIWRAFQCSCSVKLVTSNVRPGSQLISFEMSLRMS